MGINGAITVCVHSSPEWIIILLLYKRKDSFEMKTTKKAFLSSLLALLLCITMFMGTTFAWFTDSVTSSGNKIVAGSLKVDLEVLDEKLGVWYSIKNDQDPIFFYDKWEPGYTDVTFLKVENEGTLALKWEARFISDAAVSKLAEVIDVYVLPSETELSYANATRDLDGWTKVGTLDQFINTLSQTTYGSLDAGKCAYLGIALHMQEDAGNEYQGIGLEAFDIKVVATQLAKEEDSFGPDYDEDAKWPELPEQNTASAPVTLDADGRLTADVTLTSADGSIVATVPAGTKFAQGTSTADLNVNKLAQSGANITLEENEETRSFDVHVQDLADDNTAVISIAIAEFLPVGLNMGNYKLYHVEDTATVEMRLLADGDAPVHNSFNYDPATGDVVLHLASFSEIALVAEPAKWEGNRDYSWYTNAVAPVAEGEPDYIIANADQLAALSAIVGGMAKDENGNFLITYTDSDGDEHHNDTFSGKYIKLVTDVNLGDKESENNPDIIFYPIGYWNSEGTYEKSNTAISSGFYTFEGTFDGNGNTISNFYQNTWEMKGDHNWYDATLQYYRDGMGLFGKVYGGTVKNLTVDNFSSDGEIATTGVIAAYADGATFENIAITNCNPRVYNIGNGGIVGCVGWYAKEAGLETKFKNITVDNTNKISALWGSYDVACGGIVGQYYPTSGQSAAEYPVNAGIDFVNCHVAAQMDVYNDVCANYQYYAYRYTGMLIGSVRENETIDGHVYPKMDGITASGCTVHFGDWNDYYYCEIIDNTTASYTHDYQMSRLTEIKAINGTTITYLDGTTGTVPASGRANYVIVDYTKGHGTNNATCYHFKDGAVWTHDMGGIQTGVDENGDGQDDLKEDKQHIYLEFNNLVTGYGWGVTSKGVGELAGVTILDRVEGTSVEKFESKFTGDFLYRVGNADKSTVSLGTLFEAKDGATIINSGVWVKVEAIDENMNVSGAFTANTSDWTKGTIQFSGTGVVKVTIQDYFYCTPTVLYLEVVDAVNATEAMSATSNNVVLLQDAGFSSLEVSGGYALYGNGFTLTCGSDSAALDMGYAFVTLENGTLDNVQIVTPNFDYAVLYKSNMTESGNRSETTDKTRYFNVKSGVMVSGNSQILNSRISGARAAVNVTGGNVVIDNSRIELGAVASLLVGAANSVTLRDVTLVQKPTASTYDPSKILMGFSVLMICNSDGDAAPVTLEGTLVQNAWVDENDKQYVPSAGQSIISTVLAKTEYLHDLDGDDTNESLNLGFAYMPESLTSKVNATTITDNRTNKDAVLYDYAEVSILNGSTYVYSYKNTNGTADSFKTESEYVPNKYSDIITVNYSDTADGLTTGKSYGTDGWVYELNVDLDKLSGYALDFSKLSMTVNGVTVTDYLVDGSAKPASPVTVNAGGKTYILTATVNDTQYVATFKVTGTETSKDSPQWSSDANGTALSTTMNATWEAGVCVASSYGGAWSGAAPALQGVYVRYWSVAEGTYKIIHLAECTPTTPGKQNGTETTWTYSPANGDFTLTLTGGQVHSSNSVYAMPVSVDTDDDGTADTLYFVAASSNGLVNTGNSARTVPVTYSFKDNNGGAELTGSHTWSVEENKDAQYKYSDFCNGTFTQLSSSSGSDNCLAEDTLITLADGTQVRVDSLTGNEELLVWNMETGMLDKAPIMFVDSDAEAAYEVIKLYFSDGTEVKVISEHGFWDYDLNRYVYLDRSAADYIGHTFAKQNGDELEKVQLVDVVIETEVTTAWSPVTVGHLCYFVNGMLSMPGGVGGLFNIFEVDPETMTYDYEQMEKDIEAYGLFTYEELNAICPLSEEMFNAAGGAYLKISIGKGNLTMDELVYMINRYSEFFE